MFKKFGLNLFKKKDKIERYSRAESVENQLKTMWDQQEEFVKLLQQKRKFPEFPVDISSKSGQQFLDSLNYQIIKELVESGQHLKNCKSHRSTEIVDFDFDAYVEELADSIHFLFELCIYAGITRDKFVEIYLSKGEKNCERINSGY